MHYLLLGFILGETIGRMGSLKKLFPALPPYKRFIELPASGENEFAGFENIPAFIDPVTVRSIMPEIRRDGSLITHVHMTLGGLGDRTYVFTTTLSSLEVMARMQQARS